MPSFDYSAFLTQAAADARYQALGGLSDDTPVSVDSEDSGSPGVSTDASRADHAHPIAAWTSYTPTNTNVTLGNGVQVARYVQIGDTVHWSYKLTFGSSTAFDGTVEIGLPASAADSSGIVAGFAALVDANGNDFVGVAKTVSATKVQIQLNNSAVVNATSPMTWTTSDALVISGTYEAAS